MTEPLLEDQFEISCAHKRYGKTMAALNNDQLYFFSTEVQLLVRYELDLKLESLRQLEDSELTNERVANELELVLSARKQLLINAGYHRHAIHPVRNNMLITCQSRRALRARVDLYNSSTTHTIVAFTSWDRSVQ